MRRVVLELREERLVLADVAVAVEVEAEEELERLAARVVEQLLYRILGPIRAGVAHVEREGVEAHGHGTVDVLLCVVGAGIYGADLYVLDGSRASPLRSIRGLTI